MFQLSTRRDRSGATDAEHAQPLLGLRHDDRTILPVEVADHDIEATALDSSRTDLSVRFQEEVQVIGPPLRSTLASREVGVYVSCSPFFILWFSSTLNRLILAFRI